MPTPRRTLPADPILAPVPVVLADSTPPAGGVVERVAIYSLFPSDLNPRKTFPAEAIEELAASIAAMGLIQPLTVRAMRGHPPTSACREVYVGGKRLRALMLLHERNNWPTHLLPQRQVPVIRRDVDDRELLRIAVAENVNRTDMHPLEEGEAFAAMLDRDADLTTAAIGEIYGKTERWVQERVRVARNIADSAREHFREGRMTLAQARALSRYPVTAQAAVVRQHGPALLSMAADRVTGLVAEAFPPVACALFERSLYTGAFLPAEGQDGERFADVALFEGLQKRAIADRLSELRKRWAWAERMSAAQKGPYWQPHHSGSYRQAAAGDRKAGAILLVSEDLRTVKEFTGWLKLEAGASGGKAATPKDPVETIGPSRRAHATAVRTAALQAAMATRPDVALARSCLALMGCDTNTRIKADTEWRLESAIDPAVAAVLDRFAAQMGMDLFDRGATDGRPDRARDGWPLLRLRQKGGPGYNYNYYPDAEAAAVPLFRALLELGEERLLALHTALVAARTTAGVFADLGDSALTVATAEALGIVMATQWWIDDPWLAHLKADELHALAIQINHWCLVRGRPEIDLKRFHELKVAERRSLIAGHVEVEDVTLIPPEMEFLPAGDALAAVREWLTGTLPVPPVQTDIETAIAEAAPAGAEEPPAR